jgi:hypothetical protein
MGLNLFGLQIAKELALNPSDARAMVQRLRQGIVDRQTSTSLYSQVECDEVYAVAGHKGHIRMLENVKQATIGPLIRETIVQGSVVYTDEYEFDSRLLD